MEMTYWNSKGTHQDLAEKLQKLIPTVGAIKGSKNAKLERFRKMSNSYYDIFNNGGMNRMREISSYFGRDVPNMLRVDLRIRNWDAIHKIVEPIMDEAILAAAREQALIDGTK